MILVMNSIIAFLKDCQNNEGINKKDYSNDHKKSMQHFESAENDTTFFLSLNCSQTNKVETW